MGFGFDEALKSSQAGQPLSGKDGILTPLIKQLTEAALAAELEAHIDIESCIFIVQEYRAGTAP